MNMIYSVGMSSKY